MFYYHFHYRQNISIKCDQISKTVNVFRSVLTCAFCFCDCLDLWHLQVCLYKFLSAVCLTWQRLKDDAVGPFCLTLI